MNKKNCKIIWLTGLSGSGKTTISKNLLQKLKKNNFKVIAVDGDKFRKRTKTKNKFTKKNIIQNNYAIIDYLKQIINFYDFIIVSVISPLRITRARAKKIFSKNYLEIYIKCKIKALIERDTKGLYKLAQKKKIKNLIGFNSRINYERSNYRVVVIKSDKLTIKQSVNKVLNKIK
tara:strand:+ start:25 stop:549 length:525 start_codon:yes stop_codon:yes gene_type:complete